MSIPKPDEIPIVAIDTRSWHEATRIFDLLSPRVKIIKLGLEMIHTHGHGTSVLGHILGKAKHNGIRVLIDSKLNDIPNTMRGALDGLRWMGVWGFTFRISISPDSVAVATKENDGLLPFGVSVLSSMTKERCRREFGDSPKNVVARHARKLIRHKGPALICSGHENETARVQRGGKKLILANVGIRPKGSPLGDQKRIMTPANAIHSGANHTIIGRPITQAPDPIYAFDKVTEEIATALANMQMV